MLLNITVSDHTVGSRYSSLPSTTGLNWISLDWINVKEKDPLDVLIGLNGIRLKTKSSVTADYNHYNYLAEAFYPKQLTVD